MAEIKALVYQNEIEMLKDFMDPESDCCLDNLHLQWEDELYSLLKSLGDIVTAPGFDIESLRNQYKRDSPMQTTQAKEES